MGLKQDDLTHFSCETCIKMYKIKVAVEGRACMPKIVGKGRDILHLRHP